MINDLIYYISTNPLLVGGIGTLLFGSVMYFIRDIPMRLYKITKRIITIDITLTSDSFLYHQILGVLSRARIGMFARNYSTDSDGDIVSGFGPSIAIIQKRLVSFNRELIEKNLRLDEKLHITIYSRDVSVLRTLIATARLPKDDGLVKIYAITAGGYWTSPVKRRKRELSTLFVNGDIKDIITAKIKWFLNNERWYTTRGIPYKLVFLLHGEPGTGKSSLVYSIASHFDRNIGAISNLAGVDDTFRGLPPNTFAVIEDIDMISTTRDIPQVPSNGTPTKVAETTEMKQLNVLHVLINSLDGISTPHGLVVFITTNFRERLDAALIRPGRVDCDLEITSLDIKATEEMFIAFYGQETKSLIQSYTRSPQFKPHTGAVLQQLFMTENADRAIERLCHHARLRVVGAAS